MQRKILMVCLGNICRSPLAEGILKSKLTYQNHIVNSAGTANYHIGKPPDKRSVAIAKKYGIDISRQRCRQFKVSDFDIFDLIFVMDKNNYQEVIRLARNNGDKQKVDLILNLTFPYEDMEVPDPYYGGEQGFENVFKMLDDACETFVKTEL